MCVASSELRTFSLPRALVGYLARAALPKESMKALVLSSCLAATFVFAQDAGTPRPQPAVTFTDGLSTPESVLYDADTDSYLVSNINGAPLAKDNNGFIAELSPDGKVINSKLIEGGKKKVTLHAPKGTALASGSVIAP